VTTIGGDDHTAVDIAKDSDNATIAALLLQAGADPSVTGVSAAHWKVPGWSIDRVAHG